MNSAIKVMSSVALLAVTSSALAEITPPSEPGGQLIVTGDPAMFVQTSFNYQTSSGVWVDADEDAVKFVVAARHQKGRFTYGGDSEGGRVAACENTPSESGFTNASTPTVADGACAGTTGGGQGDVIVETPPAA